MKSKRSIPAMILVALLVLVADAAAADSFALTVVSENNTTITFSYPQQAGYGYLYSANGVVVSRTNDPTRTQVKFAKASSYEVATASKGTTGSYPPSTPPPPPTACSDGIDNDNPADGKIDYPADPGCSSATDTDETDVPPGPTTMTGTQFSQACNFGATVQNVTVTSGADLSSTTDCHAVNVTFQSEVKLGNGTTITGSRGVVFYAFGKDNWTIDQSYFDGHGVESQNLIWDHPAGVTPDNWRITRSTFTNFYSADASVHSEALYVGYSTNGLIEGNTFFNNGNTSHVFFTNFGDQFNGSSYPRNICVRGNTFGATHGAFFDVNFHPNVSSVGPAVTNIRIDPDNVMPHGVTNPEFVRDC